MSTVYNRGQFTALTVAAAAHPDMSPGALRSLERITRTASYKTGRAHIFIATVAAGIKRTTRTVARHLRQLQAIGALWIEKHTGRASFYRVARSEAEMRRYAALYASQRATMEHAMPPCETVSGPGSRAQPIAAPQGPQQGPPPVYEAVAHAPFNGPQNVLSDAPVMSHISEVSATPPPAALRAFIDTLRRQKRPT